MGANETTGILKDLVEEKQKTETTSKTPKEHKENKIDNSFYTNSLSFTQSDFDDFNDLKEDINSHKIILHIIIVIITIAIIAGIIILLNNVLNLKLF